MARTKGETTKLQSAKKESESLRATIPSFIVKTLHLKVGDQLAWEIESLEGKIIKISVVKLHGSEEIVN